MEGQLRRGCGPETGRKAVSAFLAASVLYLGLAQNKVSANAQPEKDQPEQTELSRAKPSKFEAPGYEQMYASLIKEGTELAATPGKRGEAVETFMKAIGLHPEKAQKQLFALDEKARNIYLEAMQKAGAAGLEDGAKGEKNKEEKKNNKTWLWVTLGVVGAAAAGYGIYKLLHKESPKPTPPPQPVKVTLDFDVYNHTKGYLTHFTRSDIVEGSAVTINVNDLGVSGVDQNHLILREDTVDKVPGAFVGFDKSSGAVTFTAPKANKDYDVFVLNNTPGGNLYYLIDEWVDKGYGILRYNPSAKWCREDRDGITGPEQFIFDVVNELNAALDYSWAKYGALEKVDAPVGSGADFGIGYGNCDFHLGIHSATWAGVNPNIASNEIARRLTFFEEVFELMTRTDDLNGDTATLIAPNRHLNDIGKDLWAYVFIKDTNTRASAAANALNAVNQVVRFNVDLGNGLNIGLAGNAVSLGYKGKQVSLANATELVNGGVRNATNVNYTNGSLNASIATIVSPTEQVYSAQGSARLKKLGVELGLRGTFDARNNNNALGFTIGRNNENAGFIFSYDLSNARNNRSNAFRMSTNFDLGGNKLALTGAYTDSRGVMPVTALSIGANADLSQLWNGLSINGSFNRLSQGAYQGSVASLGLAKQLGPGRIGLSIIGNYGKIRDYEIAYTFSK